MLSINKAYRAIEAQSSRETLASNCESFLFYLSQGMSMEESLHMVFCKYRNSGRRLRRRKSSLMPGHECLEQYSQETKLAIMCMADKIMGVSNLII